MKWLERIKKLFGFKQTHHEDLVVPPTPPVYQTVEPYEIRCIRIEKLFRTDEVDDKYISDCFARRLGEFLIEQGCVDIVNIPAREWYITEDRYVAELHIAIPKQNAGD